MSREGRKIEINGITLNVVIQGSGTPVLLLHGFPDSASLWRGQISFLAERGFRVIAPDLRGFGDSAAPAGRKQYRLEAIAGDIVGLMEHLRIDRAAMVGHDWGAMLGWFLAIHEPCRVERYAALSVGHPRAYRSDARQLLRGWYAAWFQVPFLSEWSMRIFDWGLLRFLSGNHTEMDRWIEGLSRPGRLTAALNWYRANFSEVLLGDFPPVRVPVLGVWSDGDAFLTEKQMLKSASYIQGDWRYDRIEGSGHWIPLDAAERLNRILFDFLKD